MPHRPIRPIRIAPFAIFLALAACSGDAGLRSPTDARLENKGPRGQVLVLAPVAGDAQSGRVGTVLADSLVVQLRTPSGSPVPNAVVTWAVVSGGGSVAAGAPRTDAQGRVRAAWTLGSAAGPAQARAVWHGDTVVFAATQTPPTPEITVVGGQGRTGTRGTMGDVYVRVTDAQGAPMPGTEVTAEVLSGGGFIPWASDVTSTEGDGYAWFPWVLGLQAGENRLAVRADGVPGEAVVTATGLDATLMLGLDWPPLVVDLQQIPYHSSYGAWTYVEGIVTDSVGNRVWLAPITFAPNKGETGATVLTGTGDGEWLAFAAFFWEGWMREDDYEIPRLVVSYEGQTIEVRSTWDAGERAYQVFPSFSGTEPFTAGTTVQVNAYVEEVHGLSVPNGLPVFLSDDAGWSAQTVAGATVGWPLGAATGTRTLRICLIDPAHTCEDFPVQVQ